MGTILPTLICFHSTDLPNKESIGTDQSSWWMVDGNGRRNRLAVRTTPRGRHAPRSSIGRNGEHSPCKEQNG